jgi:hypothetical protein
MDDGVCADCTTLYQAALVAIIPHNYARSQLALAKLQRDSPRIKVWGPVVKHLLQARSAAVRAYQEHVDTYGQKAAESGA